MIDMSRSRQTSTIEELISAIKENRDNSEIKTIIYGLVDVNQTNNDRETPLHWAASIITLIS